MRLRTLKRKNADDPVTTNPKREKICRAKSCERAPEYVTYVSIYILMKYFIRLFLKAYERINGVKGG